MQVIPIDHVRLDQARYMTTEGILNTLNHLLSHTLGHMFSEVAKLLTKVVVKDTKARLYPLSATTKLKTITWTEFSQNFMQVPEGLVTDLPGYTSLILEDGIANLNEFALVLDKLDTTISQLLAEQPIDIIGLRDQVNLMVTNKQNTYLAMRNYITDNTLSHQPINKVIYSPKDAATWLTTVDKIDSPITHATLKQWVAKLTSVAAKLDAYVNMVTTSSNREVLTTAQLFSKVAHAVSSNADILVTVGMAVTMLQTAAIVFTKQIREY